MVGPWFFSGRRFVATRALKDLRRPQRSPVLSDVRQGSYLALFWILDGHHDEAQRWAVDQVHMLGAADRMLPSRVQAHAGFYHYRWGAFRDEDGVPAELALEHPFAGVVLVMIDRSPGVEAAELDRWYREQHLPRALPGSGAAMCLGLEPIALPNDAPAYVPRPAGLERRSLQLHFLDAEPRAAWTGFEAQARALAESGLGEVTFAAPFIPTVPGSDLYCDEL